MVTSLSHSQVQVIGQKGDDYIYVTMTAEKHFRLLQRVGQWNTEVVGTYNIGRGTTLSRQIFEGVARYTLR